MVGALRRRRDVGKAGGLRHALGFHVVLAGGLMLDGHAEVLLVGLVGGLGNRHPFLVGADLAAFGAGVGVTRLDGANFLVVFAAVRLHVHQHLVPGVVELGAERFQILALLGKTGSGGLERIGGADQGGDIDVRQIPGHHLLARVVGGLPEGIALVFDAADARQSRFEVGLLLGPVGLRLLDGGGNRRQIEVMDDAVVPLHLLEFVGQVAFGVHPVRGFLLDRGGLGKSAGPQAALLGQQRLHLRAILAAVLLFQRRELLHLVAGELEVAEVLGELLRPLLAGGDSVEQVGFGLEVAKNFVLPGSELGLGGSECAALGIDLRAQVTRQIVQSREEYDDNQNAQ
ncbi:hypothetical protein SBA6_740034 [Candidatus Sulfopaludibacter sp. SbA6]|nr:hypothetical protein SBA6_740034 [Candidatus Sulfopaludibacter sp. SbA6]